MKREYKVSLEHTGQKGTTCFLRAPFDPEKELGSKRLPVKGTINGVPYRSTLCKMPIGGIYAIPVCRELREQIGAEIGDIVQWVIEPDRNERTVEVPAELASEFKKNTAARQTWDKLAHTHRKEYANWITSAKKEDTRARRIERSIELLTAGKKTPG